MGVIKVVWYDMTWERYTNSNDMGTTEPPFPSPQKKHEMGGRTRMDVFTVSSAHVHRKKKRSETDNRILHICTHLIGTSIFYACAPLFVVLRSLL